MRASGRSGTFRYSYQVAAVLNAWTLEPVVGTNGHRFRLSVTIGHAIDPWSNYRPLDIYLDMNGSHWIWNAVEIENVSLPTLEVELHEQPIIMKRSKDV